MTVLKELSTRFVDCSADHSNALKDDEMLNAQFVTVSLKLNLKRFNKVSICTVISVYSIIICSSPNINIAMISVTFIVASGLGGANYFLCH